ncbi:hypothetical protein PROFUN_06039 [Planoprotostelium fungivorum]|uniref:rRNA-processing protein UTP23 n=1 Tax=Planoprotostelium fungivorum TaxID=1890364 RepID=A0A2P6NPP0_9EUKA|nr:hypothetical protein PROFUN_06039 [Planoprotostelium fungivorum]
MDQLQLPEKRGWTSIVHLQIDGCCTSNYGMIFGASPPQAAEGVSGVKELGTAPGGKPSSEHQSFRKSVRKLVLSRVRRFAMGIKQHRKIKTKLEALRLAKRLRKPPYRVFVDGSFMQKCLEMKVIIDEKLPIFLGDRAYVNVTTCLVKQLKALAKKDAKTYGPQLEAISDIYIFPCEHTGKPKPYTGEECMTKMIKKGHSSIFASDDKKARKRMMTTIENVVAIFVDRGQLLLDTRTVKDKIQPKLSAVSKEEKEMLKALKPERVFKEKKEKKKLVHEPKPKVEPLPPKEEKTKRKRNRKKKASEKGEGKEEATSDHDGDHDGDRDGGDEHEEAMQEEE